MSSSSSSHHSPPSVAVFSFVLLVTFVVIVNGVLLEPGSIVSTHSNRCIDILFNRVVQYTCSHDGSTTISSQSFYFEPVEALGDNDKQQYYRIRSSYDPDKCLSVENGSKQQGTSIVQTNCLPEEEADYQLWYVRGQASSSIKTSQIVVKHTDMCLDIWFSLTGNGINLIQFPCNGGENSQQWTINSQLLPPTAAPAAAASDRVIHSRWDGPYDVPIVPTGAIALPDGKILGWSAESKDSFAFIGGQTWTTIIDPYTKSSSAKLISETNHDMFCSGTAILSNGNILITGGSNTDPTSSIYNPYNDTWIRGPDMKVRVE